MTVFKTYFKILNKNKGIILLYIGILLLFSIANMQTNNNTNNFTASKPDVAIINKDVDGDAVENLKEYLENNAKIIELEDKDSNIDDALFYRQADYVVFIPKGYSESLNKKEIKDIDIKMTPDYDSTYMDMLVKKYYNTLSIYLKYDFSLDETLDMVTNTLQNETKVEVRSTRDTSGLTNASYFYNFLNYSLLSVSIYAVSILLNVFNQKKIKRRNLISSTSVGKINRILFLSNFLIAVSTWILFTIISFVLLGDVLISTHGIWFLLNSFVFTLCASSLGFLIGNIISNRDAINGIVNVVGLGSSFLCGSFVPLEFIPENIVNISKVLPSYWFIQNNETIKAAESFSGTVVNTLLERIGVMLIFMILFFILTAVVVRKKRKEK